MFAMGFFMYAISGVGCLPLSSSLQDVKVTDCMTGVLSDSLKAVRDMQHTACNQTGQPKPVGAGVGKGARRERTAEGGKTKHGGVLHMPDGILGAELRHQGLLRELQDLAEHENEKEKEYKRKKEEFVKNMLDGETEAEGQEAEHKGAVYTKTEVIEKGKEVGMGVERGKEEGNIRDEAIEELPLKLKKRGSEEKSERELEELLEEELKKKTGKRRNEDEWEEQLEEEKKKRHGSEEEKELEELLEEERKRGDEKRSDREIEDLLEDLKRKRVEEEKKNEMFVDRNEQEGALKELMEGHEKKNSAKGRHRPEEMEEILRKLEHFKEEEENENENIREKEREIEDLEDKREKERKRKNDLEREQAIEREEKRKREREDRDSQQKRVMEKASDEATWQFGRESYRHHGLEKAEKEEKEEGEELLEIESELSRVAAELRELRRG